MMWKYRGQATEESNVPFEFWQPVVGDSAPRISAPWGETIPARTVELFGSYYFNPYTALNVSSKRFADWQHHRATLAVYGVAMSREEYEAASGQLPPRRTRSARMQLLYYGLLLDAALFIALLHLLATSRAARRFVGAQWILICIASVPMFAMLAFVIKSQDLGMDGFFVLVRYHLLRFSDGSTASVGGAVVAIVVVAAILARCAEWCVARTESTVAPPRATAIG